MLKILLNIIKRFVGIISRIVLRMMKILWNRILQIYSYNDSNFQVGKVLIQLTSIRVLVTALQSQLIHKCVHVLKFLTSCAELS